MNREAEQVLRSELQEIQERFVLAQSLCVNEEDDEILGMLDAQIAVSDSLIALLARPNSAAPSATQPRGD